MIFEYREYPKIGNCPSLPACIILHMDMRKKGSFLFLGFPCTRTLFRTTSAISVAIILGFSLDWMIHSLMIDNITTFSWKYMTEWRDYSNPRDDSLDV